MTREGLVVGGILVIGGIIAILNSPRSAQPRTPLEAAGDETQHDAKVFCTAEGTYRICHGTGLEKRCFSRAASGSAGGLHEQHAQGMAVMKCEDSIFRAQVINDFGNGIVEPERSCVVTRCSDVK